VKHWRGALPGLGGAVFCGVFALFIAPAYARMFADFGSALPPLTQLMLRSWPPWVLAILAVTLSSVAMVVSDRWRNRLFIAAAVVGIGGGVCCLVAMSLVEVGFAGDFGDLRR
jgi:hypothetical protein